MDFLSFVHKPHCPRELTPRKWNERERVAFEGRLEKWMVMMMMMAWLKAIIVGIDASFVQVRFPVYPRIESREWVDFNHLLVNLFLLGGNLQSSSFLWFKL
jgi:hypothetical protein